eukprot:9001774-Alexandrium_andersonii.AAC.1
MLCIADYKVGGLRRAAARAVDRFRHGRCLTTALGLWRKVVDPGVLAPFGVLKRWVIAMVRCELDMPEVEVAWRQAVV